MSTTGGLRTRLVKKVDPPRPLKSAVKSSASEVVKSDVDTVERTLLLMNVVSSAINNYKIDEKVMNNIMELCSKLKIYGPQIDNQLYQSQLDECYIAFREVLLRNELSYATRLHLLQVIELRERNWKTNASDFDEYYQSRGGCDASMIGTAVNTESATVSLSDQSVYTSELVKRSGRYLKPVRFPGKNYCKDEIIIRNADSGKVMGIKGRRVHMIEQLSETIISFQRVQPTAKERLVQITGPTEDNIKYATCLIGETIRSNTSPITDFTGSNCSLNSVESEEDHEKTGLSKAAITNDLKDEYMYKHNVLINGCELTITGNNYSYVSTAKNVLDEFFVRCTSGLDGAILEGSNRDVKFDLPNVCSDDDIVYQSSVGLLHSPTVSNRDSQDNFNGDYFGITKKIPQKANTIRYKYSKDILLEYRKSPLSSGKPAGWERISRELPQIVRK